MIKLRPYQEKLISDIRESFRTGNRRVLAVLPTAGGKTVCFSYIAAGVYKSEKRVLIIAHRRELLKQISESLKMFGIRHAVLQGGARGIPRTNVVVASVFTVASRLKHWPEPDLIIGDEAHHFTPDSTWGKVVTAFPKARVLGVTATPIRSDGTGLGLMFDDMVIGPTVSELTDLGFLAPAEVYAPSVPDLKGIRSRGGDYAVSELEELMGKSTLTGDAVKHYLSLCPGKKAVAFCVSVKHAERVADAFRQAGIRAASVDGSMDVAKRDGILKALETGGIDVLTSCDLISEGFNLPAVEVAILLRPTKSTGLYIQQVGRSLRIAPGKTHCTVLDHANCTRMHGFIDDDREWELTTDKADKRAKGEQAETVRTCPECFAAHRPMPECPKCGHVYQIKAREVKSVDGNLEKLERGEKGVKQVDWQRQYYQLVRVAERRGVGNPKAWAFNIVCNQEAKRAAQRRDVPNEPLINGLTEAEREAVKKKIGVEI